MDDMENPREVIDEFYQTAHELDLISKIEIIRHKIEVSKEELESLSNDPSTPKATIESMEQYLKINLRLLRRIEKDEEDFYEEIDSFE